MISAAVLEVITPEELTRAASVFGALKQLRLRLSPEELENKLDQAFENHVASVLGRLDNRLPSLTDNNEMRKVEVIMARHGLYDAAFQQAILLGTSISPALGEALRDIRFIHSGFMTDMQKVGTDFNVQLQQTRQYLSKTQSELEVVENECKNLIEAADLLDKEADAHEQEILDLRSKLRNATMQVEKFSLATQNSDGNAPLSPFASSQRTIGQVFDTKASPSNSMPKSQLPSRSGISAKFLSASGNGSVTSEMSSSQKSSRPTGTSVYSSDLWLINFRTELQKALDNVKENGRDCRTRMLSFNETLDLVDKFYETKKQLNTKCGKPQLKSSAGAAVAVFETMEQHVYHSYEKKYGLRSLALEHCSMFISALELYSDNEKSANYNCPQYSNVDIRVFNKILKNELDENFHEIHLQLSKSIRDLIVLHIMNRYPNKTQEAVQELLDKKLNGVINSEEWTDIVNYLYNGEDARSLLLQLKRAAKEEHDAAVAASHEGGASPVGSPHLLKGTTKVMTPAEREKETRRLGYARSAAPGDKTALKLAYSTPEKHACLKLSVTNFLLTVFTFQLQSHEMYLTKFVRIFHKHDSNGDGIVTAEEFRRCFLDMRSITEITAGPVEGLFAEVLHSMDPNQTGSVTFTNAAECLSKYAAV